MSATNYDMRFYSGQRSGSAASATVAIPLVAELVGDPRSVVDVGCGVGTWLASWVGTGVTDVIGVDGDYVDRDALQIAGEKFLARDLEQPLDLGRRFDLAMSLEVAEHLPETVARQFIQSLCRHSEVVLFSAAVPGQGGTHHVNEQWPSYWAGHFAEFGYRPYDLLRPKLWSNEGVEFWYAQNTLIYANDSTAERLNFEASTRPIDLVHPRLLDQTVENLGKPWPMLALLSVRRRIGASLFGVALKRARRSAL